MSMSPCLGFGFDIGSVRIDSLSQSINANDARELIQGYVTLYLTQDTWEDISTN